MHDDGGLSRLQARVRTRVAASQALVARAHARTIGVDGRADAAFARAEAQLDHVARALPAVYGLAGTRPAHEVPDRLLQAARSVYRGCRSIGLAGMDVAADGTCSPRSVASTGVAGEVDAAQWACEEGPGVDALELDQVAVMRVADLGADDARCTWPRFTAAALELGVRTSLSIALPWRRWRTAPAVGVITLYAAEAHAFPEPESRGLLLGAWAGSELLHRTPAEIYDAVVWRPQEMPASWSS
jgi:hypothetical protein